MNSIISLTLLAAILATSCAKTPAYTDKNSGLGQNECTEYKGGSDNVKVCFQKIVSDSRCPANVVCVWAGVGVAQFTFSKNGEQQSFSLSTSTIANTNRQDTTIEGYKIQLVHLYPYPGTPKPAAPSAEIKITKL